MRATLLCLAVAVQLRLSEEPESPPEPDQNAEMRQEIYELKRTVSEQSADLAKLARIIGTRQDQLEGKVRNMVGDVQSLRGRGKDATSICSALRSCGECVASPICGWCSVEQACVPGDHHGSLHGECQFYDFSNCKALSCATYPTCAECVADPVCGFCATDGLCAEGSENGPEYGAKCTALAGQPGWLHMYGSESVCPAGLMTGYKSSVEHALEFQKIQVPQETPAPAAPITTTLAPVVDAAAATPAAADALPAAAAPAAPAAPAPAAPAEAAIPEKPPPEAPPAEPAPPAEEPAAMVTAASPEYGVGVNATNASNFTARVGVNATSASNF